MTVSNKIFLAVVNAIFDSSMPDEIKGLYQIQLVVISAARLATTMHDFEFSHLLTSSRNLADQTNDVRWLETKWNTCLRKSKRKSKKRS